MPVMTKFDKIMRKSVGKNIKNWYTIDALGAIFTIIDTFTILLQYLCNTITILLQYF